MQRVITEKSLSDTYGTNIGSESGRGGRIKGRMLQIIARVLAQLPLSHTAGNDLLDAIIKESGEMGAASTYGYDANAAAGERGLINMTVPPGVPALDLRAP